jgi:hypothetical protein
MNLAKADLEITYFGLSQSDALIHEMLKPQRPLEYCKPNVKIPLKYKDPEVSIIKKCQFFQLY